MYLRYIADHFRMRSVVVQLVAVTAKSKLNQIAVKFGFKCTQKLSDSRLTLSYSNFDHSKLGVIKLSQLTPKFKSVPYGA